jgi:hypothetical protein
MLFCFLELVLNVETMRHQSRKSGEKNIILSAVDLQNGWTIDSQRGSRLDLQKYSIRLGTGSARKLSSRLAQAGERPLPSSLIEWKSYYCKDWVGIKLSQSQLHCHSL